MNEQLLIEKHGSVLQVTLNRPDKYNAISDGMLDRLRHAVERFGDERDLRVMLIRAVGKYFTAGVEISPEISPDVNGSTLDGRTWYRTKFHRLFDEIEAIEKPVAVAHQGVCLGGGLELSLSCDFRLAAKSARYGLPEIDIGALPGSGGVSRPTPHCRAALGALVGDGRRTSQRRRRGRNGFRSRRFPRRGFRGPPRVQAFCAKLAKQPYEVMGLAKLSIELAADLDRAQGRNVERIANSILFTGAEHKALVAAFLERQAAKRRQRNQP